MIITATKKNTIPYQTNIPVASDDNQILLNNYYIEEGIDTSDGFINSGETVDVYFEIESNIFIDQGNYVATLQALSDNILINNSEINFDLQSNNIIGAFTLSAGDLINNEEITLYLNIAD